MMKVKIIKDGYVFNLEVTQEQLDRLVADLRKEGYKGSKEYKGWSNFINETENAGGIPFVLETIAAYSTIAIFKKGA